ncbi:Brix domain-containing protein [Umbelopsis sp. AD052]|nr:Brix domain-containing protein [Umbelopsis sp. AD052]
MAKRRRKTRTHQPVEDETDPTKKAPKSFVIRSGAVGRSVTALVKDVRRLMEPNTASHLKERKTNRLRDFVMVAGQLGVSHFMIFSRTEKGTNMRIARVPRGPTLTFKVEQYALAKDVLAMQRSPKSPGVEFLTSPLLVLNNFNQEGKQFKLMTTMFQNMFPSINVQTMQLADARRVVLLNYNSDTNMIDFRHYAIGVKPIGVSKSVKKIITTEVPNLADLEDISEYVLREAVISESDVEDGPESTVTLGQDYVGRGNRQSEQRAIRLHEIGPRMQLTLTKVENGLCGGEVLYHHFVEKSSTEIKAINKKRQEKAKLTAQRRSKQEENVKRKQQEKEEHRLRTGGAPAKKEDEDEENSGQESDGDEKIASGDDESGEDDESDGIDDLEDMEE